MLSQSLYGPISVCTLRSTDMAQSQSARYVVLHTLPPSLSSAHRTANVLGLPTLCLSKPHLPLSIQTSPSYINLHLTTLYLSRPHLGLGLALLLSSSSSLSSPRPRFLSPTSSSSPSPVPPPPPPPACLSSADAGTAPRERGGEGGREGVSIGAVGGSTAVINGGVCSH